MPNRDMQARAGFFVSFVVLLFQQSVYADRTQSNAKGREAVASVRHDWKKNVRTTVLPVPANFGQLSPEARLVFLHARRNLNRTRFDANHPHIGPLLAADDRLRAAQSQGIQTMNGLLPDNSLTRYLNHRRGLNPARFDHYHPTLGAILVEDQNLRRGSGMVAPDVVPPNTINSPPNGAPASGPPVGGGPLPTRAVPEPTSLVLLGLGAIFVLGRFRRGVFGKKMLIDLD